MNGSNEIANAFNQYFWSFTPSLASQIQDFGIDPISYSSES